MELATRCDLELGQFRPVVNRAGEVVGLPVLVDQPQELVRMPDRVCRKLGCNDQIDPVAVDLAHVQKTPGHHFSDQALFRIVLERKLDQIDLHAGNVCCDRLHEAGVEILRAAARKRHLRAKDQHALGHFRATTA